MCALAHLIVDEAAQLPLCHVRYSKTTRQIVRLEFHFILEDRRVARTCIKLDHKLSICNKTLAPAAATTAVAGWQVYSTAHLLDTLY